MKRAKQRKAEAETEPTLEVRSISIPSDLLKKAEEQARSFGFEGNVSLYVRSLIRRDIEGTLKPQST